MISVLGIRHHGPGSARSVVAALDELQPDLVLVEGPPDADDVIPLAADPALVPPVALLVYRPDVPRRAVFYPFADFSPEWQAIRWALARGVAARFCDLPMAHQLAASEPRGSAFLNRYAIGSLMTISYQMPMPMGAPSSELTG